MATTAALLREALSRHRQGNLVEAEALYRQILLADPANAETNHLLGLIAHQQGDQETAARLIRQALALHPATPGAALNLGIVLMRLGQFAEAAQWFEQVLRNEPEQVAVHFNLGNALFEQAQYREAAACYRRAVQLDPNYADAFVNLGSALHSQEQLSEAMACYRQAVRLDPTHTESQRKLAAALEEYGLLQKAMELYRQPGGGLPRVGEVMLLLPSQTAAHGYLASTLASLGLLKEAWLHNEEVLRLQPGHTAARFRRAVLRLLQGDFAGSWADFELRWSLPDWPVPAFQGPRWDGSALDGKTILIFHEQGFGDTLQFLRYLPLVAARGGKTILACQPALFTLLEGNIGADHVITEGMPVPAFDVQVPLLSLPGIFQTTLANIPTARPFLQPKVEQTSLWRDEFQSLDGLKVGIVWQGNPKVGGDALRSIPLKYFEPLADVPGVRLLSLQKGPAADQLATQAGRLAIIDLNLRLQTFNDTAAVMKNLDLLITSDTSTAHLAGAMGVPVWTLLQLVPDWRWLLEREDSPWYPTMRLFRQRRFGDWTEVFERITSALKNVAAPPAS